MLGGTEGYTKTFHIQIVRESSQILIQIQTSNLNESLSLFEFLIQQRDSYFGIRLWSSMETLNPEKKMVFLLSFGLRARFSQAIPS